MLSGLETAHVGTQHASRRMRIDAKIDRDIMRDGRYTDEHEAALVDLERRHGLAPLTAVLLENCD